MTYINYFNEYAWTARKNGRTLKPVTFKAHMTVHQPKTFITSIEPLGDGTYIANAWEGAWEFEVLLTEDDLCFFEANGHVIDRSGMDGIENLVVAVGDYDFQLQRFYTIESVNRANSCDIVLNEHEWLLQ